MVKFSFVVLMKIGISNRSLKQRVDPRPEPQWSSLRLGAQHWVTLWNVDFSIYQRVGGQGFGCTTAGVEMIEFFGLVV